MALVHLVLIAFAIVCAFPFAWMVLTALKPETQIFKEPTDWMPRPFEWHNFPEALTQKPFFLYFLNSLKICACSVCGTVLASSMVAYSLSKIPWKGRTLVFYSLIATMILPAQVTMIPSFMIFKWLGWVGTMLPLTVPPFLGTAFSIFLIRQFMMTIPNDLSDAARIDGCSELGIYWRIVMPLAKTALVTVGLFAFVGSWNDFLGPLLYLNDDRQYTLSLGLQSFLSQHNSEWGQLMAASSVVALPIVIIFFFAQRTFISGVVLTGSKE